MMMNGMMIEMMTMMMSDCDLSHHRDCVMMIMSGSLTGVTIRHHHHHRDDDDK